MTDATDLMKGHHILTEVVPNGHGKMVKRQVLFFRGDAVIRLLQERNAHLQEISDRLAKAVEKHKARKALLDDVYALLSEDEKIGNTYWCECRDNLLARLREDATCPSNEQGS